MPLTQDSILVEGLNESAILAIQPDVRATANSTLTLSVSSLSQLIFTGTTAGQIVQLPNATTLRNGWTLLLWNTSNQSVAVKDNGLNAIVTVAAGNSLRLTLQSNAAANGTWTIGHDVNTSNPHATTATQVGLGNVTNEAQIAKSIGTTKGDLIVFTGSGTPVREAVGANGQYLVADSTDANGMKWRAPFSSLQFYAEHLDSPNNANWVVNALAPASADSANAALVVRRFDDTAEEGVGFKVETPVGATSIVLAFRARAQTAPTATKQVILRLYTREIPDNAAVTAWSAATQLTAIDIPITNAYFQYDTQTIALSTLGLTAGRVTQFELTRYGGAAADTLVGDWDLLEVKVDFI
jgi:hypothetical protein